MKSLSIAAIAVSSLGAAAPAFAQDQAAPSLEHPQGYLNLGYTYLNPYGRDLGEITGRGGLRLGRYWGVEGEFGGGVIGNHFADASGRRANLSEGLQASAYAVGYLPLMGDKLDLLARVGYGGTALSTHNDAGVAALDTNHTVASWNYGAGAQYMLDGKNGVRFDYTRRDFQAPGLDNPKDTNTYAVSYVRKF